MVWSGRDSWRAALIRVGNQMSSMMHRASAPLIRRFRVAGDSDEWWRKTAPPWQETTREESSTRVFCNICRWSGAYFVGTAHVESASCPRCGAIARDRFLLWCFLQRSPTPSGARLLETSPRLGEPYRRYMRRWFDYRTSDFDLSAHAGDLVLDLQDIALPTASVDIVLTPHVLEHVPDTARALRELFRIIAPGGRMYLQVPVLAGTTSVPTEPEFHADNTPVFYRFGWDLTDAVRAAGFESDVLVTDRFRSWLVDAERVPPINGNEFAIESLVTHARPHDLTSVASDLDASRLGFLPPYQFVTWECRRA